jgi:uncharacterized protein (TIGR00730 family)
MFQERRTVKNICVFSSSSDALAPVYFDAAAELGTLLAQHGYTLVYGAGSIGLMGQMARTVHANGGRVIGVIPEVLKRKEVCYYKSDELIVTQTMRQRKQIMDERADAFVIMPGGFGTFEEMFEILTAKQLQYHNRAIVFVNTNRFFDPMLGMFEHIYREDFAKPFYRDYYHVVSTPVAAIEYLQTYQPPVFQDKWF